MKIRCSYSCAATQQPNTATLFRAKCSPHCSLLLCKTGLQQACIPAITPMKICFFIQVCSDPSPEHCITVFCKMQPPQLSAALQTRPTAGLCHCNYTYEGLLFIQVCSEPTSEPATLFSAKCIPQCSVLLCKAGLQQACITAITPMKISSSCRCAVTQHQNTATLFRAKCSPHCSLLLCKTGLQQACITATTPMKVYSSYRCAVSRHQNLQHCFL